MVVVTGKDKGKSGVVATALPRDGKVVVEGVNIRKKHQKPRRGGQKGSIIEKPMPIDASNVMIVDPKAGTPTRIGIRKDASGRARVAKKSGEAL